MTSKAHSNIVRTPIELQLQRLNQFSIMQQKNMEVEYHLLRLLNEIVIHSPQIVNSPIFLALFNEMLNYEQAEQIKMLPLFEMFGYRLWSNESFNFQVREKTSFYAIISNWIIYFELKSGNLQGIANQFELISSFMAKETRTGLERMVMMEEIYEDLKDFIDEEFWQQEEHITGKAAQQNTKEQGANQANIACITKVLQVVEAIVNPIYYRVHPKESTYKNCTYGDFEFRNCKEFVKKSLYFLLRQRNVPSHLQTEISKVALIHLQSLDQNSSAEIVNMLKHLMLSTSKPVRFALIIEYVEFYEYLEMMGFEEVIEQLEGMIYFRQLIIGKRMVEESIVDIGNSMNDLNLSYHELYVKAGTSKKVYFSNQSQDNILKLDVLLEENDINIRILHYCAIKVETKGKNINKFVYETVHQLNQYDASRLEGEKGYWKEERSTSKKLQLKLQFEGLYCVEFDNCYSWVIPKNVKYRLDIYQPFK